MSLVYFLFRATLNPRIELAAVLFIGLVVLVGTLGILAWRRRVSLEGTLQRVALGVEQAIERAIGESDRFGTPAVTERVDGFIRSLERIARDPRQLGVALAFSAVGWLCLVIALWLSLYAIGYVVPFEVVMFVVPLAITASITPLPGGAGGIEATYILLLVALTPISVPAATAAVLLYRTGTYLLPVVAGGGAIVMLGATKSEGNSVESP
ncbi:lysylphosphatidylglycerol synthase transmembrane domain-containing protein [Haladaptatus sp. W1]|uniref:lysylphosphatidylglycerol synthase transmembrane domain-containing protein n=1 Tax=Haladaptatus sp. W1 TaxID=1897478 RepID=UPI0021116C98|nr:lysylphosphatidylglycerol synthase transmembrane domain-containing protein [Haladaptatus sp. W1]